MLYQGPLIVSDEEAYGEVWNQGDVAVMYLRPSNRPVGPMRNTVVELDEAGNLVFMGDVDGEPTVWRSTAPEHTSGTWRDATVTLADGTVLDKALVQESNRKTRVTAGGATYDFAGARVRTLGSRQAVIQTVGSSTPDLAMVLAKPGCGCSGGR